MLCIQCVAGETVFPTAGGDLASGWGESSPGSSDTAVISQGGTYTASGNLSFGNIKVTTPTDFYTLLSNLNIKDYEQISVLNEKS